MCVLFRLDSVDAPVWPGRDNYEHARPAESLADSFPLGASNGRADPYWKVLKELDIVCRQIDRDHRL